MIKRNSDSSAFKPSFKLKWAGLLLLPFELMASAFQSRLVKKVFGVVNDAQETPPPEGPEGLAWEALEGGGGNFKTHQLKMGKDGVARIVLSLEMWLFVGVFALVGLGVMMVGVFGAGEMNDGSASSWLFRFGMIAFGSVFFAAGVGMIYAARSAPSFDVQSQYCRGLKPGLKSWREAPQDIPFSKIIGVQVFAYLHTDSESSYPAYQMNLVAKDLSRWKVMSSSNLPSIEADAQTLSQLLRVPLWKRV